MQLRKWIESYRLWRNVESCYRNRWNLKYLPDVPTQTPKVAWDFSEVEVIQMRHIQKGGRLGMVRFQKTPLQKSD